MLKVDDICAGTRNIPSFGFPTGTSRRLLNPLYATATFIVLFLVSSTALGDHVAWKKYSRTYEVNLGVVTAEVADRDGELRSMHAASPHGMARRSNGTRHIMVAVFKRADRSRVLNADVTTELVENDLVHVKRSEKALDTSNLSSGTHYCNFFDLHWNGKYRINVRIHEPGKNAETVTFVQEENDL